MFAAPPRPTCVEEVDSLRGCLFLSASSLVSHNTPKLLLLYSSELGVTRGKGTPTQQHPAPVSLPPDHHSWPCFRFRPGQLCTFGS